MEYSRLEPVAQRFREFTRLEDELRRHRGDGGRSDAEMRKLAHRAVDLRSASTQRSRDHRLLVPKDPRDDANVFLEIRAGTGGDEAAIFAGDLFRMYSRYAEQKGWKVEVLSESRGEHGGYKEVISRVEGERRLLATEVRVGRASRATRAGDGSAGPHPYVGLHGRDPAGARRNRGPADQPGAICASTRSERPAPAAST